MFESAELGHAIDKDTYAQQEPALREALLMAQHQIREKGSFPVLVIVAGMDGGGKGETVNQLNEWMDPRLIETKAFDAPTDEERERPRLWRYWRALPPKGKVGIHFGSWYVEPMEQRFERDIDNAQLDACLEDVTRLEKMLVREGVLILKFWFHLSEDKQRARLKKLAKDPLTSWRVGEGEWDRLKSYKRFRKVSERVLRQTDSGEAPWIIVEGEDARYRNLTVGRVLLEAIKGRLANPTPPVGHPPSLLSPVDGVELLDRIDLSKKLDKDEYETELLKWQGRLNLAMRESRFKKHHSVVAVFEGNDAAGKGGCIRRVTAALDARQYETMSVAAPSEEERAQPYLWRFWRRIPRRGELTVFDRSWYGRVLVERVEGFASEADWLRAYAEINDFEAQLVKHGVVVVKFWLTISPDEQLKRFKEREETPWKNFKITEEDYRNREKLPAYTAAVNDMVERTSTEIAPWTLVEAEDKRFARVKVLRTLATAIEQAI